MQLLKFIYILLFIFGCQYCYAGICVNSSSNAELFGTGLGTKALEQSTIMAFHDSNFSDYKFFSARTNAELVTQIQDMVSGSCSIILGLMTSRECLIAGPILKKSEKVGISPICGHDAVGKFYPYLFTGTHPISKAAETTVDYLNKVPNLGKIFAIHQPTDIYGEAEFSQFRARFTKPIIEVPVGSDGTINLQKFSYNKAEKVTLVFFVYPLFAVGILEKLYNQGLINKNVEIIGASSWNDNAFALGKVKPILKKAKSVVAADVLNWKQVKSTPFVKFFVNKYHREPLNVEILNYDITRFAVRCYRVSMIDSKYDGEKFKYCMTHTQYNGVSGVFSFSNHSSFADRPLYLTNIMDRI